MNVKYKNTILFCLLISLLSGCTSGYLDINDDPNKPTKADLPKLLAGAEKDIAYSFTAGDFIGSVLPSYVFYLSSREVNNYSISPSTSQLVNTWEQTYVYALKNTNAVIKGAEESDNLQYAGIGKLLKAYAFTSLVDLFGDIPYTEFDILGNYQPKADKSKDIYINLLNLIQEAKADLLNEESANLVRPAADDLIYAGSKTNWIAMANTLTLKLLVQSRKAKSEIPDWDTKLAALLTENNFIKSGNDFEFKHTSKDNPDERHPAYADEYLGGQSTMQISPYLYEMMNGKNLNVNNPFENIQDPRIPYYWVNQIVEDGIAQNPTDYRDGAFVSNFFASNSIYSTYDQRKTSSFIGIYACGGKYDDKKGGACDKEVGTGVAPEKMLQAYSVPFLLAELYLTNEAMGDPKAMLIKGIEESIKHVNKVSQAAQKESDIVPVITDVASFTDKIGASYDLATTNEEKLRVVMIQKWIANYFNPVEAYTDIRRTGYPELISPTTLYGFSPYKPDKTPALGPVQIPLTSINPFPRALWYSSDEVKRNMHMTNEGRILSSKLIFWDK